ncbi:basic proline-rich protein-like [Piliocolobus tephrosceles]|uniref:basic proline-rich protein-like n=1 Tax=Piliocolobus tephrosceles TaxID=591936 RepID=UPI000E6AFBEB|nr:basic proline-rich protein-like [Piliocolobus tephrosceles]
MGGGTVIASRARRDPRGRLCADFRHRYPPAASPTPPGAGAPRYCSGPGPLPCLLRGPGPPIPGMGDSETQTPQGRPPDLRPHARTPMLQTPTG